MRAIFLTPIKAYQLISKFTPSSCRYYPSCSEYSKWLFSFDNPLNATLKSALRIGRCNQLFSGGIDYPSFNYTPPRVVELFNPVKREKIPSAPLKFKEKKSKLRIKFWLVPNKSGKYYIVKDFNATATYLPTGYASSSSPR
ncbi:MAG: membrane protein insertion efficiency factor YidD [Epsilonproteobacteria bacterium]|nr:membrane protein insertion efficiency factor YidD [Campylobacterota bacterium]